MQMKLITSPFRIKPEAAVPIGSVETLYNRVFGPAWSQKASHRLREGIDPIASLCWVTTEGARVIGAIRYWPIRAGASDALLLGPLAIAADRKDRGIGTALVVKTLAMAAAQGHDLVLLAGDPAYYQRFGFVPATARGFGMVGESRPERLQILSLQHRPLDGRGGVLRSAVDTVVHGHPAYARTASQQG